MKRVQVTPREDWQTLVHDQGLYWVFTDEGQYWDESVAYEFSAAEIDKLYEVTEELNKLCLDAVAYVIKNNLLGTLGINPKAHAKIIDSWERREPTLYGRFDFLFDGKNFKLLEYNADTPTTVLETSVIQWHWKQALKPEADQFNSLEEDLISRWKVIDQYYQAAKYHFASAGESDEDHATVMYLLNCLLDIWPEGNLSKTQYVCMEDIAYDDAKKTFLDLFGNSIGHIFKLYPYEWMMEEEFADPLVENKHIKLIEPWWKMILSNKAILPILWELNEGHPNLLPAYFDSKPFEDKGQDFVVKPFYSREGADIRIVSKEHSAEGPKRNYDTTRCIFQEFVKPYRFDDKVPLLGSWVVGNKAAGLGIREDSALITSNFSRFVPHYFVKDEE